MADITVTMKDGTVRKFEDRGAPGGSYSNHLEYKPGFVVITDPYGKSTSIPTADVAEVVQHSNRRW